MDVTARGTSGGKRWFLRAVASLWEVQGLVQRRNVPEEGAEDNAACAFARLDARRNPI